MSAKVGMANGREQHYSWQDDPTYKVAHGRLIRYRGRAYYCAWGCEAARYEWANLTGNYSDLDDYAPMCTACHQKFDYARHTMAEGFTGHHTSDARTKLTAEIVQECRALAAAGARNRDLARRFGMSEAAMSNVLHRKAWRFV